jgi:sugar lactone lactonase YvrE
MSLTEAGYADVPHQHCRRVAEGGRVLETVTLDRGAFACMLGGTDVAHLYVVAARWPGPAALSTNEQCDGQVLRTAAPVAGAGWPAR